jgi:hypothetical protein
LNSRGLGPQRRGAGGALQVGPFGVDDDASSHHDVVANGASVPMHSVDVSCFGPLAGPTKVPQSLKSIQKCHISVTQKHIDVSKMPTYLVAQRSSLVSDDIWLARVHANTYTNSNTIHICDDQLVIVVSACLCSSRVSCVVSCTSCLHVLPAR